MKIRNADVFVGEIVKWKTRGGGIKHGIVVDVSNDLYRIQFYDLIGHQVGTGLLGGNRSIISKFSDVINVLVGL